VKLRFGDLEAEGSVRKLGDMLGVCLDAKKISAEAGRELYFMFRGLGLSEQDREAINAAGLRYDVTVIPPGMLGRELAKTAGHAHPKPAGSSVSYPELYQVLEGCALYLIQKNGDGVSDVAVVEARAGDVALMPPDYGHVTINPASEPLKMANWVAADFKSDYEPYKKMRGAAYYVLEGEEFLKNENYGSVPEVRRLPPTKPSLLGLKEGEDTYALVKDLSALEFLKRPQDFTDFFLEAAEV